MIDRRSVIMFLSLNWLIGARQSAVLHPGPTPVRVVALAAHRDRPREAALRRRVAPETSAQLLAQPVKCGGEVACVPYTTHALSPCRFSLTNDLCPRGGTERGNSTHPARPYRPYP